MKKAELVARIAELAEVTKAEDERMLKAFEEAVTEAVAKGKTITLPGFVKFEARLQKGRTGKVPGTDKTYATQDTKVPKVSAGKTFKEKVAKG